MSHRRQLHMGAININSNRSACYDSKVQHADFTDLTHDLDIIGITETHSSMESDVQKQGYKHFAIVRKKATLARAHSGGYSSSGSQLISSSHFNVRMVQSLLSHPSR